MAKIKLEVGKTYENRFGKRVKVVKKEGFGFYGDDGLSYGTNGTSLSNGSSWDLIKEVKKWFT